MVPGDKDFFLIISRDGDLLRPFPFSSRVLDLFLSLLLISLEREAEVLLSLEFDLFFTGDLDLFLSLDLDFLLSLDLLLSGDLAFLSFDLDLYCSLDSDLLNSLDSDFSRVFAFSKSFAPDGSLGLASANMSWIFSPVLSITFSCSLPLSFETS